MALKQNIIYVYFKGKHLTTSKSQYQYNHGQFLYFADLDLPQAFEVHFSNEDKGYSKPKVGSNKLVEIPDEYFWSGASQIYAWVYLHGDTNDGETIYEVKIPLTKRAKPTDEEPLPQQESAMERAIAELNNAVEITTENANKTEEDKTQVGNIRDEVVDLKENIDATAETVAQKSQDTIDASRRSEASAQNAAEFEDGARRYSEDASQSAQEALESKNTAKQKAQVATDASAEALGYRDETKGYRDETLNIRNDASTLAQRSAQSAQSAEDSALQARTDAETIANYTYATLTPEVYCLHLNGDGVTDKNEDIKFDVSAYKGSERLKITALSGVVGILYRINGNNYPVPITETNDYNYGVLDHSYNISAGMEIVSTTMTRTITITATDAEHNTYTFSKNWTLIVVKDGEQGEPATDMDIHICSASEYDSETRIPTIASPDDKTFYLVPTEDGTSPDLFTEWVYVNNAWEMFGSASVDLTDYVKNTDYASTTKAGVVKINPTYGIGIFDDTLVINGALATDVKNGNNSTKAVSTYRQHESTFYGLAKVAGHDEKNSELPVGQYTDEAKSSIQNMLDVPSNADLDEVEEKVEQNTEDLLKAFPVETASGSIASFEDGANDIPLQSLVVDINPVQDLHGYDSPWVGGGGKNKLIFPYDFTNGTEFGGLTANSDDKGIVTISGTKTANSTLTFKAITLAAGTYTASVGTELPSGASFRVYHPTTNTTFVATSTSATFTLTEELEVYVYIVFQSALTGDVNITIKPQIEEGSTATDWTPYENICPISGWEGVTVNASGINIWDEEWEEGDYHVSIGHGEKRKQTSRIRSKNFIPVVPNATYFCVSPDNNNTIALFYDKNKVYGNGSDRYTSIGNRVFTIPSWAHYITFYLVATSYNNNVSINYLSTNHEYHPYTGRTISISWQTEAGTVYGGTLDVLSGKLIIDRYAEDLSQKTWTTRYTGNEHITLSTSLTNAYLRAKGNQIISENYALDSVVGVSSLSDPDNVNVGLYWYNNVASLTPSVIYVVTNVNAIPSGLVVYTLATPIEIQLTPTVVRSLLGTNNIWADTGNTSVEYCADTELYIEKVKPSINVDDVQIDGQSIVTDGVANIPIAGSGIRGVVSVINSYGLNVVNGNIAINRATGYDFQNANNNFRPIVTSEQHNSVFYGLAKAAGDATQSQSSNTVGNYTDNAKDKIQTMLGVSPLIAPHESDPFESAHVVGELFIINSKLYRAKTALAAGDYINEGTNVEVVDVAEVLDGKVDDVQVNGTSVVTGGVANIPIAGTSQLGLVKSNQTYGIGFTPYGEPYTIMAGAADIKSGNDSAKSIVPNNQHRSVFYGLAKASGDSTQSASDNAVGTYTDEAKTAIKQMLGIHDTIDSFVEEVTGTDVTITGQPSYRYNCGEVLSLSITPPSSGTIDIRFTSGSTPTVLTLPQTVKMPEWWVEVEANTIYEMCITDGIYCGVMTWAI